MVYTGTSHVFQPEHRIVAAEGKISGRNLAEGTDQPDPSMRTKIDVFLARLLTGMPILGRLWGKFASIAPHTDIPWSPMGRPLPECRICLITTGGLHLRTDNPFNMEDPEGDPSFRLIPATVTSTDITITHNYYDHKDADRDFNIVLPLDRVRELVAAGYLGGLTPMHYSFMGHIDGRHLKERECDILPELIRRIRKEAPDFVFLTPA
jgi:D-proline reductase (dithiol) PrdB